MPLGTDIADPSSRFPSRLSRRLSVASALVILAVLAGGGFAVFLATKISHTNTLVRQEYNHALSVEQLHVSFHAMIATIERLEATGDMEALKDLPVLQQRLAGRLKFLQQRLTDQLKSVMEQQKAEPVPTDLALENPLLAELQRLVADVQSITDRIVSGADRIQLPTDELIRLESLSDRGATVASRLIAVHQEGVGQLLTLGQQRMRIILMIYLALFGAGAVVIAVAGLVGNRAVAAPLHRLAEAAQSVADGHLDVRVPVRSRDEIGKLSYGFNVMVERLEARERELALTHDRLRRKISETHALYRMGNEISGMAELEPILRWAVDKAQELLGTDAAALCLVSPGGDALFTRAHSGPQDVFRTTGLAIDRVRLDGPSADVCSAATQVFHPERIQAVLTTPLRRAESVIGVLIVASIASREFSPDDSEIASALATQSAIAIDNARLYEEVQGTAALEERRRLSREIHDGLAQMMGMLYLKIRYLQGQLDKADSAEAAKAGVEELATISELAYEEARQSIFGLRTMVSRSLGLVPTLTEYLHEFGAQSGVKVSLGADGSTPIKLPPEIEVQIIRILQEALHNVRRHAEAKHAWVRVHQHDGLFTLAVEDDGKGWDRGQRAALGQHFGLQTMQERAESLDGTLTIDTAPGQGTRITATVPLERTQ